MRKRLFLSLLLISRFSFATTYFVSLSGGSDGNAGTSSGAAWQNVSKVNGSSFSAGDIIQFNRGETWPETLTVPSSGSAGNPITFTNYGTGNLPILGTTVKTNGVVVTGKSNVTIDGIQVSSTTGILFAFTTTNNLIIRNSRAHNTPANHGISFAGVNTGVQVLNNTVDDDLGRAAGGTGIICQNNGSCNSAIIDGNTVTRAGDVKKVGILAYDSSAVIIRNNVVTLNDIGIQLHTSTQTITSGEIYGNKILDTNKYGGGDGEGAELTGCQAGTASTCVDSSTHTITASFHNNLCMNLNTTNANDCLGTVVTSSATVYGNIVIGPFIYGFHPSSHGDYGNFFNNSIYNTSTAGILSDVNVATTTFKNNIIYNSGTYCMFAHATSTGTTEDYNLCFNSGPKGGLFLTTGAGTHNFSGDPRWVTVPPISPFSVKLQVGSGAAGNGLTMASPYNNVFDPTSVNFPFDYVDMNAYGSSWEIGAYPLINGPSLIIR